MKRLIFPVLFVFTSFLSQAGAQSPAGLDADAVRTARTILGDMKAMVSDHYYPQKKITPAFSTRCEETDRILSQAKSMNEAFGLIADALASVDRRIRFYPPNRTVRVDYSWNWRILGNAAFVTQVDREGDAAKQGLKLGDRILSLEGMLLDRDNFQQIYYVMNALAPRTGLRIQAQSPGEEPRWLAIAATIRPQRKTRTVTSSGSIELQRVNTPEENRRFKEFLEPQNHVRRIGRTIVWQAHELRRNSSAVADGLKLVRGAAGLVLDLRGQYIHNDDPVLRLLDGLFAEDFEAGVVKTDGFDHKLRIKGGSLSFAGTVVVLVDAETAGYAEVLARIIQQRQRGVIVGDRTMGRVFEDGWGGHARGAMFSFTVATVTMPTGEVQMADGVPLDGRGVTPDFLLLPSPADLAGHRDIVLSKALAMVKESLSPEDAYNLYPHYEDIDDDY
jgi:C-terminal processing protease CtpA/Prc